MRFICNEIIHVQCDLKNQSVLIFCIFEYQIFVQMSIYHIRWSNINKDMRKFIVWPFIISSMKFFLMTNTIRIKQIIKIWFQSNKIIKKKNKISIIFETPCTEIVISQKILPYKISGIKHTPAWKIIQIIHKQAVRRRLMKIF